MTRSGTLLLLAAVLWAGGTDVRAHQITYKGTVLSAAPKSLRVSVVDEKTKKPAPMTFVLDEETKILRGDTLVTFAAAKIQKGEAAAVTIDHDFDWELAIVVRLADRK